MWLDLLVQITKFRLLNSWWASWVAELQCSSCQFSAEGEVSSFLFHQMTNLQFFFAFLVERLQFWKFYSKNMNQKEDTGNYRDVRIDCVELSDRSKSLHTHWLWLSRWNLAVTAFLSPILPDHVAKFLEREPWNLHSKRISPPTLKEKWEILSTKVNSDWYRFLDVTK